MKTLESGISPKEDSSNFRVEHLPGADIILNLDYPNTENQGGILAVLRDVFKKNSELNMAEDSIGKLGDIAHLLRRKLMRADFVNQNGHCQFWVKPKLYTQDEVDFVLGRIDIDPLTSGAAPDFDNRSRYARAGILNEIVLSRKVKELIASPAFQELAKKYGFAGIRFAEPIVAIVEKKYKNKYLIYDYVEEAIEKLTDYLRIEKVAEGLRKLFQSNGITPHDLRPDQLMVTGREDQRYLILTDIEAYTKAS